MWKFILSVGSCYCTMIIVPPDWTGSFLKLIPILSVLKILDLLRQDGPVHKGDTIYSTDLRCWSHCWTQTFQFNGETQCVEEPDIIIENRPSLNNSVYSALFPTAHTRSYLGTRGPSASPLTSIHLLRFLHSLIYTKSSPPAYYPDVSVEAFGSWEFDLNERGYGGGRGMGERTGWKGGWICRRNLIGVLRYRGK